MGIDERRGHRSRRDEHLGGRAVRLVGENESVYIPLGVKHRMENPGKLPMVLIEVQSGSYLGEDDITRYEDRYARRTPGE